MRDPSTPAATAASEQLTAPSRSIDPLRSGTAAGPGAGGEDDRVGAGDRLRELLRRRRLEVADHRLGAVGPVVVGVAGVADQATDPIATPGQQPRQPPGDLPCAPAIATSIARLSSDEPSGATRNA